MKKFFTLMLLVAVVMSASAQKKVVKKSISPALLAQKTLVVSNKVKKAPINRRAKRVFAKDEAENLLTNGGFEDWTSDTQPTGWEGWQTSEKANTGGAKLSKSEDAHGGSYACRVAHESSNKRISSAKMNLGAGTYTVTFFAKATDGSADIKPGYVHLQDNGTPTYDYGKYADGALSLNSSWKEVSYDITLTKTEDVAIIVMNYKNGAGDFLIDDVTLTAGGGGGGGGGDAIEYDCSTSNFSSNYTTDLTALYDDDFADYNVIYVDAESDEDAVWLEFNLDAQDSETVIPTGTYKIDGSGKSGTVSASTGYDEEGYATGSSACTLVEIDGDLYMDDAWFLVDGTVTVSCTNGVLKMVVDAVNSCGKTVKSTIECEVEGGGGGGGTDNYSIDFTKGQGDWTIDDKELPEGITYVWAQDKTYGMKASAFANKVAYAAESWLISPVIDLSEAEEATLSFQQALNKGTNENLAVLVSDNGGDSWYELDIEDWPAGTDWNYITSSVSLNEYVGKEIKLAFKYVSTTDVCPTWEIKTVEITGAGGGGGGGDVIEYDCDTKNFAGDFSEEEVLLDTDYLGYNVIYIDAENSDNILGLEFNVEGADDETVIPVGTYKIDNSEEPGTVTASTGLTEDYKFTYSFAGEFDEEGYIDPCWFMVSGTVKVSCEDKVLTIVVDGVNSCGKTVKSTIKCKAEAGGGGSSIYSIDFTEGQDEWEIDDKELPEGITYVWKQDKDYGMKASAFANKVAYAAESWLISPEIDLSEAEEPTLTFEQALNKGTNENLAVLVSDNGGDSWSELDIEDWPEGTDWNFITSTVDLSEYAGTSIKLAFKYVSTTEVCPTWEIKTVTISENGGGGEDDPYEYDMTTEDFDATFVYGVDNIEINSDYLTEYNCIDLIATTADEEKSVDIEINLNALDEDTIIPVGTYPINDTAENKTVTASPGNYFIFDFPTYAYADPEEYEYEGEWYTYYNKTWYVVSGEMTVAKSGDYLNIVLNGQNSKGKTVKMTFMGINPTGIEEVTEAKANTNAKAIYNLSGQKVDNGYKGIVISNGRKQLKK